MLVRRAPGPFLSLAGLSLGLVAAASAARLALTEPGSVLAAGLASTDSDADGLTDGVEGVLKTDPFSADTDQDGYPDAEELARGSDPLSATAAPASAGVAAGLDASAHDNFLHLISTFYLPTGNTSNVDWQVGVMLPGRSLTFLPKAFLTPNSKLVQVSPADPNAALLVIDTRIRPDLVHTFGSLSVATTLCVNGQVAAADSIDVESLDGVLVRRVVLPGFGWSQSPGPGNQHNQTGAGQAGPWTIFQPLSGGEVPSDWTAGQVCVQETQIIGSVGSSVTQEVVAADCQSGWDGYCSSSCQNTVGETKTTIDAGALIGG